MSDFNKVILMGRIGNDLELKSSAQGKPYVRMSLATHNYKPGEEPTTHWHRVVVFGSQAEHCSTFLRKGSQVMIDGSLEVRTYNDKEGRKNTTVSVIARHVTFMDRPKSVAAEEMVEAATA